MELGIDKRKAHEQKMINTLVMDCMYIHEKEGIDVKRFWCLIYVNFIIIPLSNTFVTERQPSLSSTAKLPAGDHS